jgi:hypothetical protein
LEARVTGRVFLGPLTRVALSVDGETLLMDLLNAGVFPRLHAGDSVKVRFAPPDAHLL